MNSTPEKRFSVDNKGTYIHLKTWGQLDINDLDAPINSAIALANEHHIDRILDDIRDIDSANVSLYIQTKAAGIMWKLRKFKKVAIVFKSKEIGFLFFSMLHNLHLSSNFKGFDDESEAIAWIQED
ncbi:MAG TPA: STAS/SEC14 domain-containing protein [Candidatus Saccharimonadales bacterium]|nr:STAS/SEC14 domain-containing protein [Candidatus Saccharimonadales bacterium]